MIDVSAAKPSEDLIEVIASDNIFEELGNNTYTFLDLISELLDNSIAARVRDQLLEVVVTVGISVHRTRTFFMITDNAAGIPRNRLGDAISPAAVQNSGSLNEHGLGMKQAVASLGKLGYLLTKTNADDQAILIDQFKYGKLAPKIIDVGIIVTRGSSLHESMHEFVSRFAQEQKIDSLDDLDQLDLHPTRRQQRAIGERVSREKNPLDFASAWTDCFVSDKYGEATTHWRKLIDRINRGVGNPCPLLLIGLSKSIVTGLIEK